VPAGLHRSSCHAVRNTAAVIDVDRLKRDIQYAEQQRDRYKQLHKEWKQIAFRLKSDLLKAEAVNAVDA